MSKNFFIVITLVLLVGIASWFFIQKTREASDAKNVSSFIDNNNDDLEPSPTQEPVNSVKLPNGLEIIDNQIGVGVEARAGNVVAAHYKGTLENGTVFDESYSRGQPFSFVLGGGQVIKGWDLGIIGMKVGGKRTLIVPPSLGYGSNANGPIPANSTLIFEVELIDARPIEDIQ